MYKIHRFDLDMGKDQYALQDYLNRMRGEVVSIVPHIARTSLLQIYGLKRKIDYVLIVEKVS